MKLKTIISNTFYNKQIALLSKDDASELGANDGGLVYVKGKSGEYVATSFIFKSNVKPGHVVLSKEIARRSGLSDEEEAEIKFCQPSPCLQTIHKKIDGLKLNPDEITALTNDINTGRITSTEQASWITALQTNGMELDEIAAYATAMVDTGEEIKFAKSPVYDFHSLGGVPGNKITPIVVSICAQAGLTIPKTSSRAISSACGTSDFVELFCPVELTSEQFREVGNKTGGAFVWGGGMELVPVDDILIKVEYELGLNPRAQMFASIIGKKLACNSEYLLIDIPMGHDAKVKDLETAEAFQRDFKDLGEKLGIHIECIITYANQPIGHTIGPALEARECLKTLEGNKDSDSIVKKACTCASIIMKMAGIKDAEKKAYEILESGKAREKFLEIVKQQGGNGNIKSDDIKPGKYTVEIVANRQGHISNISNKGLVRIARALGAPSDKGAGIELIKKMGRKVEVGEPILRLYADNESKLNYAKEFAEKISPIQIEDVIIKSVD